MAKIAVLGYGVVGSGVCETLRENEERLAEAAGQPLTLGYVLELRDCPGSPFAPHFTKDYNQILEDEEVAVVAEVIGGTGAAYDFTRKALEAGKHVVTSNKELVATRGAELLALAKKKGVLYLFEASVGGGIPIIRPMSRFLCSNRVVRVTGILNGTCNYILTAMSEEGQDFDEALKCAQELGYAERDPSADVDGHDTCRKISILSSLAFGRHVYPQYVHTEGIRGVTKRQMQEAAHEGYAIKLLGHAESREDGRLEVLTAPYLVPSGHPLYSVTDVFNGIMVTGHAAGEVMFTGKGAGRLPTASAVLSDILDCVTQGNAGRMVWRECKEDITVPVSELRVKTRMVGGTELRVLS